MRTRTIAAFAIVIPILLSACKNGLETDDVLLALDALLLNHSMQLDLSLAYVPELMAYNRLFTEPARGANGVLNTTSAVNTFQAGAAKVSLTGSSYLGPYVGDLPLAGFNREAVDVSSVIDEKYNPGVSPHHHFFKKSDGVLDEVDARAVVIQVSGGGERVAFVVLDTVAVSQDLYDTIFNQLTEIDPTFSKRSQLFIAADHTHSGPGGMATRPLWKLATMDIFVPQALTGIADAAVAAIIQARDNMQNAELDIISVAGPDIVANRRRDYYTGTAPLDQTLTVMQIRASGGGSVIATIFNFAIHGTVLPPLNTHYSGDCLGEAMRRVESNYAGSVALFINGAEGDVKPSVLNPVPLLALLDVGGQIADKVIAAAGTLSSFQTNIRLKTAVKLMDLPTPQATMDPFLSKSVLLNISLNQSVETTAYFSALYLEAGTKKLLLSAVPGEAITEVGQSINASAMAAMVIGDRYAVVSGLTNGHIGYIVTADQYAKGGYEAAGTLYGSGTAADIEVKVSQLQTEVVTP